MGSSGEGHPGHENGDADHHGECVSKDVARLRAASEFGEEGHDAHGNAIQLLEGEVALQR